MIRRYSRCGLLTSSRHGVELPPYLRYQRYQFTHITGEIRVRSYRSGLRVGPPKHLEECPKLIRWLAGWVYMPNGSVDVEDLVQIGEAALWEGLQDLRARAIRPNADVLTALLEAVQSAMFRAIDQHLVPLPSGQASDSRERSGDEWQQETTTVLEAGCHPQHLRKHFGRLEEAFSEGDCGDSLHYFQTVPAAECNFTVLRRGCHWDFRPNCCESWGAPLPPGSCQPRPSALCEFPRHLPLVGRPPDGGHPGYKRSGKQIPAPVPPAAPECSSPDRSTWLKASGAKAGT